MHHVQHLIRITQHRKGQSDGILQGYILWYVLYLDKQACLSGNGTGEFVRAFLNKELIMPDWTRIFASLEMSQQLRRGEGGVTSHPEIYELANQICIQGAKLCQLATKLRAEAAVQDTHGSSRQILAARIQQVTQFQNELYATWHRSFPHYLSPPNTEYAVSQLPLLARIFFEYVSGSMTFQFPLFSTKTLTLNQAQLQFSTNVIYSNSSIYPGQPFHLSATQSQETRLHSLKILSIADAAVRSQNYDHHQLVFPLFLTGFAATDMETKSRAISLMRVMEGTGISRNPTRSRELLVAVCEEQRLRVLRGGRAEEVDWISFARAKGMSVVNFGL